MVAHASLCEDQARRWVVETTRAAAGIVGGAVSAPATYPECAESEVTRLLMRHRLAPLLHEGSEEGHIGTLPAPLADLCREVWFDTLRRNWAALDVAEAALTALADAGVPVAPVGNMAQLCGPKAAQRPALRPAPRWRLAVAASERGRAAAALRGLGLERITPVTAEPWVLRRRLGRLDLRLALHAGWTWRWGCQSAGSCSAKHFLAHCCRHDGRMSWPRIEPHLLLQCCWAVGAGLRRGIWLWDLDREIRSGRPDWSHFVHIARCAGTARQAWLALHATRTWFASPIPPEVLDGLAPPRWLPSWRSTPHRRVWPGDRGSSRWL